MAERLRLSVPSGQQQSHRLEWADAAQSGNIVAAQLGSLEWSAVVLDELTVDLEVSAQYRSTEPGVAPGLILLQEMARGTSHRGTFDPAKDSRFAALRSAANGEDNHKGGIEIDAIIFEFSNTFSWWTGKEIELIMLRIKPPGEPLAAVPPLPLLQPLASLPHADDVATKMSEETFPRPMLPNLHILPNSNEEIPSTCEHEVSRYASRLDSWLAAVESTCPSGVSNAWLEDLLTGVAALRGKCQKGPIPAEGSDGDCNTQVPGYVEPNASPDS